MMTMVTVVMMVMDKCVKVRSGRASLEGRTFTESKTPLLMLGILRLP